MRIDVTVDIDALYNIIEFEAFPFYNSEVIMKRVDLLIIVDNFKSIFEHFEKAREQIWCFRWKEHVTND